LFFVLVVLVLSAHRKASPQLRLTVLLRLLEPEVESHGLARRAAERLALTYRTGEPIQMKSILGGSAAIASALLAGALIFSAQPSVAETLPSQFQQQKQETVTPSAPQPKAPAGSSEFQIAVASAATSTEVITAASDPAGSLTTAEGTSTIPAARSATYVATAYSLGGRTASGFSVSRGLIAADPSVLPLGTRVRVEAGRFSGEYVVADTGGAVRGKRIDIWTPNSREAMKFGRRLVKLTVLSYGPKHSQVQARGQR
jgi:3D (Asp-Asp-Asp) domain-containing protein